MTEPTWGADIFGIRFVIDTSDFTLVTFDEFAVDMAANAETSLEVNGVDFQVASGKILRLLGVIECSSEDQETILTQTDTADSQVGTIDKWLPPFNSATIGAGSGPVTIFDVTFAAAKFLTVHNENGVSTRVFNANGLIGLEFTVV